MKKLLQNKSGITLLFAIIVTTAMMVTVVSLNETIIRAIQRVSDVEAHFKAQNAVNSGFERALVYISNNCGDAGCNWGSEETPQEIDLYDANNELIGRVEVIVKGASEIGYGGLYYVPIPGEGDAAREGDNCDYPESDIDANCNWNKLTYGQTVEIPLYTGDGIDEFDGSVFEVKIRTPKCYDPEDNTYFTDQNYCPDGHYLIACQEDDFAIYDGCQYEYDPTLVVWQIVGDRAEGNFVEGNDETFMSNRHPNDNSEIYTTLVNTALANTNSVVLDLNNSTSPDDSYSVENALSQFTKPVLKLTLVEQLFTNYAADSIPYLEYQIVTDEPISNNTSVITVTGYVETGEETYRWEKEGTWTSFTSSPINFAFQN